jgi:D-alanyl-D-alanine carboxypeptidase
MIKSTRRLLSVLCLGMIAAFGAISAPAPAMAQARISSDSKLSAIVIDAGSGEVLYSLRADSPRYPASVSKVMTLYLTFEALEQGRLHLSDEVTMSRHAAGMQPTKLGVPAGKTLTVEDAIQAMCIQSANDVAVAMAEHLGGTETRFAAMMTLKAHDLGMANSRFVNASGLPDSRQISSAHDIAILSRAVVRDFPQYYHYFGQSQFTYGRKTMTNHNHLLNGVPGVDGLKTGFTSASGYNLAASAVQGDRRLIVVVLGGSTGARRDNEVASLLTTGFEVARRKDAGEQLADLQTLFQAPAALQPSTGQVELASNDNEDEGEGDASEPTPSRPVITTGGSGASYVVQVGAFRQKSAAQSQVSDISHRFSDVFAQAESEIADAVNGFFKAQFKGFTAESASSACSALRAKRISCLVVAP